MAETKATTVNTEEKEKKVEEALSVKDFAEDTKHVVKTLCLLCLLNTST